MFSSRLETLSSAAGRVQFSAGLVNAPDLLVRLVAGKLLMQVL